jgi:pre-mRNA-splicing factor 18
MSDEEKRSRDGKLKQTTYRQAQDFLQPFFRARRNKKLDPDILARVTEMASFVQQREYQQANNQYLTMSIGNVPWPIGVTMVGIHERSGREKIFASKVAHVLNDEATRKWIQSLKRLMTWAQVGFKVRLGVCFGLHRNLTPLRTYRKNILRMMSQRGWVDH